MKPALLAAACLLVLSSAAQATPECEGVCDDGAGSVRTLSAGVCRSDEVCSAGCDRSEPGTARPWAQCVSPETGRERAPQAVTELGGRREHD